MVLDVLVSMGYLEFLDFLLGLEVEMVMVIVYPLDIDLNPDLVKMGAWVTRE